MGQFRTKTLVRKCIWCGETVRWIDGTWQFRGDEVCRSNPAGVHPMDKRHEVRDDS